MDEWAVDIAAGYPKFLNVQRLGPFANLNVNGDGEKTHYEEESAFCLGQRVYSYALDERFYKPGTFYCLQGQWGTEVILHNYFSHTCSTEDPETADWFYVPL